MSNFVPKEMYPMLVNLFAYAMLFCPANQTIIRVHLSGFGVYYGLSAAAAAHPPKVVCAHYRFQPTAQHLFITEGLRSSCTPSVCSGFWRELKHFLIFCFTVRLLI